MGKNNNYQSLDKIVGKVFKSLNRVKIKLEDSSVSARYRYTSTSVYVTRDMLTALYSGFASNETMIATPNLDNGLEIAHHRSLIIEQFLRNSLQNLDSKIHQDPRVVVATLGGFGRAEMLPNSDADLGILAPEEDDKTARVILAYSRLLDNIRGYVPGVKVDRTTYFVDNLVDLDGEKQSTLRDLRIINGREITPGFFKEGFTKNSDALTLYLHLLGCLNEWSKNYPQEPEELEGFDLKYGIGGLRQFQAAIFLRAAKTNESSQELYNHYPEILPSYYLLMRTRAWVGQQLGASGIKDAQRKKESYYETFNRELIETFEKTFGQVGLKRLIEARRNIKLFSRLEMGRLLREGITIGSDLTYDHHGLRFNPSETGSSAAMIKSLRFAQTKGLMIADETLYEMRGRTTANASFLDLFTVGGATTESLRRLADNGTLEKFIFGYDALPTALLPKTHWQFPKSRAQRAFERLKCLEHLVSVEPEEGGVNQHKDRYNELSIEHKLALGIGLFVKGIPDVLGIRPLQYLTKFRTVYPQLTEKTSKLLEFLLENGNLLYYTANHQAVKPKTVKQFLKTIRTYSNVDATDQTTLTMLWLFTHADRSYRTNSQFSSEQNAVNLLYGKTYNFVKSGDAKTSSKITAALHGIDDETFRILELIPEHLKFGRYGREMPQYARKIAQRKLGEAPLIKAEPVTYAENKFVVKILADDYPGLFWRLAGTLYTQNANIVNASIDSLPSQFPYALDFVEIELAKGKSIETILADITKNVGEKAPMESLAKPFEIIKSTRGCTATVRKDDGHYRLQVKADEDKLGILYAVGRLVSEELNGNIIWINGFTDKTSKINDIILFNSCMELGGIKHRLTKYFLGTKNKN